MYTVVIGVRHRTAPINIREKLAFSEEEIPQALHQITSLPGVRECAILNTCNRTEIYAAVTDTELGIRSLKRFLNEYKHFDYNKYRTYAFILLHEDVVMHLFRVASGIDSLILGEGQIMAQVKESLKTAMMTQTSGEVIEKIFKSALSAGKAVRSQTGIADRDNSIAKAAFEFVLAHHPDFLNGKIALLGAGKMAEVLLSILKSAIPAAAASSRNESVILLNRSHKRAEELSEKYGFPRTDWDALEHVLANYDTLFVATGSSSYMLCPSMFQNICKPKVIMDISVPRNVDPKTGELENIYLYNADDLSGYSTEKNRIGLIQQAHLIIEEEYQKYHQWYISRSAVPAITRIRTRVEDLRRSEVADIEAFCPHAHKRCSVIDDLSRTLINKILHDPTICLKSTAESSEILKQAEMLSRLFNISHGYSCSSHHDPLHQCGEESKELPYISHAVPNVVCGCASSTREES